MMERHSADRQAVQELHDPPVSYECKGVMFITSIVPQRNLEDLESFQTRSDDIFLATFPRSGTHWLMEIVLLILADGDLTKVNRSFMDQVFEMSLPLDPSKPPVTGYKVADDFPQDSPRVMPTHLSAEFLPPQVRQGKTAKVIYIARNLLDNLTSRYNFKSYVNYLPTELHNWSNFLQYSLSGKVDGGNWFHHVLSYWKLENISDNVLFLKYEDTKKEPRKIVEAVAKFLERPLTAQTIDRVVKLTTFNNMKETYKRLEKDEPTKLYRTRAFCIEPFLRKGEVGSWKGNFTTEELEMVKLKTEQELQGTGLTFEIEI